MDTAILQQIGLTESEIRVYFSLLELETSTVGPIIKHAHVPDSKIYLLLDKLKAKGLASFVVKNNVKHFQASDPKMLTHLLVEKQREIEKQKQELEKTIIPAIKQRRKLTQEKQEATVYEGIAGLKSAFLYMLDVLQKGEEYQVLSFHKEMGTPQMVSFFREHHKRRMEKGIKLRLISDIEHEQTIRKRHPFIAKCTRYTTQRFPEGLYLFKGHVLTVLWKERKTAFLLKSQDTYESYLAFFEELWEKST